MIDIKQKIKIYLQRLYFFIAHDIDVERETGPSLVIAPHPDDESLGCGAVIARLRAKGRRVRIVVVTNGAIPGQPNFEEIAATRQQELRNAAHALDVSDDDVVFLNFPDQGCNAKKSAIESTIEQQIVAVKPGQVFSPYGVDGHSDHRAIAVAVENLRKRNIISCPLYEYPIWFWKWSAVDHLLRPDRLAVMRRVPAKDFLNAKKAAITAHRSQYSEATREAGNFTFPPGFLDLFLGPYELFFEKRR